MFQAMATGHTTYSTMHADSVKSMVNRLENPPINTPRILLSALNNVIIQIQARTEKGVVRRLKQVLEIVGFEPETNELITNTVYEWDPGTDTFLFKGHSFLFDKIMELKNLTTEEMDAEFERRVSVLHYLALNNINDYRALWKAITAYYKDPQGVAEMLKSRTPGPRRPGGELTMAAKLPPAAPAEDSSARQVRVKRGSQPTFSTLTPFQRWAWRTFRHRVLRSPPNPLLEESLAKAHIRMRGDEYLAQVYGTAVVAGIALIAVGGILFALLSLSGSLLPGLRPGPWARSCGSPSRSP